MRSVRIVAPAKINLGLSILGKRPDGYHEIDTIMAMLDIGDVITLRESDRPGISISGMDDVPVESNLVTKAIRGWCSHTEQDIAFDVDIEKHIPSPAGLGGGSSDAAAATKALGALYPNSLSASEMHDLAASIGADCPFFLGDGAARATGTGTTLNPIKLTSLAAVIVVPPTTAVAKTAALYGSLEPADYGATTDIDSILYDLESGEIPVLKNSFEQAAKSLFPALGPVWNTMTAVTGSCSLSGAGPAMYALSASTSQVALWAETLGQMLPSDHQVFATKTIQAAPTPGILQ